VGSGGLKEPLTLGQIRPCEGAIFNGNDVPGHALRHPAESCAKMAELIEMPFGLRIWVSRIKLRRCGLMSNYFDHLLLLLLLLLLLFLLLLLLLFFFFFFFFFLLLLFF